MSLATWQSEFYPVPADSAAAKAHPAAHSYLKWFGTKKENLEIHNVSMGTETIHEDVARGPRLYILHESGCAMCKAYKDQQSGGPSACRDCPICTLTGTTCQTPWIDARNGKPERLLDILHKCMLQELAKEFTTHAKVEEPVKVEKPNGTSIITVRSYSNPTSILEVDGTSSSIDDEVVHGMFPGIILPVGGVQQIEVTWKGVKCDGKDKNEDDC